MPQGKCIQCKVVYWWDGAPLLRNAYCPTHRRPLQRTSHLLKGFLTRREHPAEKVRA